MEDESLNKLKNNLKSFQENQSQINNKLDLLLDKSHYIQFQTLLCIMKDELCTVKDRRG